MKFNNTNEVRKWLRNIPFLKREMELKIKFYKELQNDFDTSPSFYETSEYYKSQIEELQNNMKQLMEAVDKLFSILDDNERTVMTARYINLIRWDYIEFQVFYSRRQAIRVHNKALLKLVGQTVS